MLSTHSLNPCLWGGVVSDDPTCGPPASLSLYLAISSIPSSGSAHKSSGENMVRTWVQLKRWCVWMLQKGHSGDGCVLASTLCKYDLRKGDVFVLSWARVQRVSRRSISSDLLMCGGSVRSILLLPLVARCIESIDMYMTHVCFMSVAVTVWVSVGMFLCSYRY